MAKLAEDAAAQVAPLAKTRRVTLHLAAEPAPCKATETGSPQVLDKLLTNAVFTVRLPAV